MINSPDDFYESLRGLGVIVDDTSRAMYDRERAEREVAAENRKRIENLNRKYDDLSRAMSSFTRTVSGSDGSLAPLAQTAAKATTMIGGAATGLVKLLGNFASFFGPKGIIVGRILDAVAGTADKFKETAGEMASFVVEQFDKAYTTFEKLSDSGVVQTFEDLKESGESLKLNFADTFQLLSKNNRELAMLGGTAIAGRQEFTKLAEATAPMREEFQRLGISALEFREFQLSYIMQATRAGRGQKLTLDQQIEGSRTYIKELDALSKLTGVSRKDIQAQREARMRDVRYREGIAGLDKDTRKEIDGFLDVLGSMDKDLADGFKDLIATGGVPVTEAAQAAMLSLQQGGLNVQEIIEGLRNRSVRGLDAFQKVAGAAGKAANATSVLAKFVGAETTLTKNQVALRDLEARASTMTQEEYDKLRAQIEKNIEAEKGQNKNLADARVSMYDTGRKIEQLGTESELATRAISFLSEGINTLISQIYEWAGKKLPASMQTTIKLQAEINDLRKAEQQAIESENKIREQTEKYIQAEMEKPPYPDETPEQQRARITEALGDRYGLGAATARREKATQAREAAERRRAGQAISQEDLQKTYGLKFATRDIQREGADLNPKLIRLAQDIQEKIPGFVGLTSMNDNYHQGTSSPHTKGLALDFALNKPPSKEEGQLLMAKIKELGANVVYDEYNNPSLRSSGGHIHAEVAAKLGGVFSGATSGYPATLHGTEAVVPLPDGRTIPVVIKNPESMNAGWSMLAERIDTMIDLLEYNNRLQDNMFRSMS